MIISQVLPGPAVDQSTAIQIFLHERPPAGAEIREAEEMADFLGRVVGEEDLPMARGQQSVLGSGQLRDVFFGRNEGGLQHFHRWVRRLVDAPPEMPLHGIMAWPG